MGEKTFEKIPGARDYTDKIPIYCRFDRLIKTATLEKKRNPANNYNHPQKQIDLLAQIISGNGWRQPITVSKLSGLIVKGHARLSAAQALGLTVAPVEYQAYESPALEVADLLADNRIAELAEINLPATKDLLQDIDTGQISMNLTGYGADDLELLLAAIPSGDLDPGEQDEQGELENLKLSFIFSDAQQKQVATSALDAAAIRYDLQEPTDALLAMSTAFMASMPDKQ